MTRRELLERVGLVITQGAQFIATTHVRPDGDAIGSLAAFSLGLGYLGKQVAAVTHDPVPLVYRFLPYTSEIHQELPPLERAAQCDAGIALDCDGLDRTGSVAPLLEATGCIVDLDHHEGMKAFGDVQCVVSDASCTGELVLELLRDILGVPITEDIATCLLTCHVYDTGRFGQSNATAAAFRNAAALVEAGASPEEVVRHVFDTRSIARTRLRGLALSRAQLDESSACAWVALDNQDLEAAGASGEDSEGIVEELRAVAGARLALLVTAASNGESRVSLRSRDPSVNVAQLAAAFGGGGHVRAAGCMVQANPTEAAMLIIEAARRMCAPGLSGEGTECSPAS